MQTIRQRFKVQYEQVIDTILASNHLMSSATYRPKVHLTPNFEEPKSLKTVERWELDEKRQQNAVPVSSPDQRWATDWWRSILSIPWPNNENCLQYISVVKVVENFWAVQVEKTSIDS